MDETGRRSGFQGWPVPERWRAPLLDLALWAVLGALTLVELAGTPAHSTAVEGPVALLVLAVGLQRRFPDTGLTALTAYATVQALLTGFGVTSSTILMAPYLCVAVSAFRAGSFSGRSRPIVALSTVVVTVTLSVHVASGVLSGADARAFLSDTVNWLNVPLAVILALVAPWLFGRYRLWRSRAAEGGWEVAERMERTRAAEADRARLLERARITSRMHDSLGHDLALIAVRAAALEMAVQAGPSVRGGPGSGTGTGPDGEDSEGSGADRIGSAERKAAAELRTAAHEANLRLREVIGFLREPPGGAEDAEGDGDAPAESVSELVERASDAGLSVRLLREGPDPDPRSPGGRTAHRVVQEALTNAAKYAPGARVSVRVVRDDGVTRVTVEDSGTVTGPSLPVRAGGHEGSGGGLAGLRSLLAESGGSFEAGPVTEGAGFAVRAVLPDSPDRTEASEPTGSQTRRLHAEASGRARRGLFTAVAVPTAISLLVVGFGFLVLWWVGTNSVLPPEHYEPLSVGDSRAAVEEALPRFAYPPNSVGDAPPPPADADECRYYLVTSEGGLPPVYRLCFGDGVLVSKERIERTE